MSNRTFADIVHQNLGFSPKEESGALIIKLIDTKWFQRLRDISQTANTRLVFMFSEHSRFGHSLGVAHLANLLMNNLSREFPEEVKKYKTAVSAAAMLHDIGHLAPGSHTAFKTWFPNKADSHEKIGTRIINEDQQIQSILNEIDPGLTKLVTKILTEDKEIPPWTWECLSAGGWNVDRGNWCTVDSILAGVSYGNYNIPALIESITLSPEKHLVLKENRLDAMMHFVVSRHAMYRQVYQHRVLLSADTLNKAIAKRARDLGSDLDFADETMQSVLSTSSPEDLALETIFWMRESWWRYHLAKWTKSKDNTLADLADRLLNRRLFKTVRITEDDSADVLRDAAVSAVTSAKFDPEYYLHYISTSDMHAGDYKHSIKVLMDNGSIRKLSEADPLFSAIVEESKDYQRSWLVMPDEAKQELGRER